MSLSFRHVLWGGGTPRLMGHNVSNQEVFMRIINDGEQKINGMNIMTWPLNPSCCCPTVNPAIISARQHSACYCINHRAGPSPVRCARTSPRPCASAVSHVYGLILLIRMRERELIADTNEGKRATT